MATTHPFLLVEGPQLCNLQFADVDLMAGRNGELQGLLCRLVDRATAYGIADRAENSKVMTNNTNNISADTSMNGQKLEEVNSSTYVGATLCIDGTCSAEICIRIALVMSAMDNLNKIARSNTLSFANKFKMYKSHVASMLLYSCET